MMGLFMLAAIWCSIRYWRAKSWKSRWLWCIAAGMCCQFGILSKETMATIPAVVIAYWWVLVRPSGKRADDSTLTLAASAPLLVTLMSCWVTVACIYNGGFATPGGGFGNTIHAVDWWYTQSHAVFLYLKLCAWPCPLLIHYDFPIHTNIQLCWPWVMGCTILIFTTAYLLSRRSASGFVLAVFFIVLSPSLIIPLPGETIAERRMYMPLAAIAPFAVVIAVQAIRITTARFALTASRHTLQSLAWSVPVLAIIGTFAFWSRARMPAYHSQLTIWYDSMTHQPHDAVSTMNVGVFLSLAGQQQAAISCLEKAVSMRPDFERARFNLGYGYESMNQIEAAIEQYQAAVRAGTTAATYYNLARLQASAGDIEAAIKNYREACRLRPKFADAHTNLSVLLIVSAPEKKENIQEAISHLESATSLNPSAENLYKLMMAYLLAHNFQQANRTGEKASLAAQQEGDIELIAQIETANRELQTQLTAK